MLSGLPGLGVVAARIIRRAIGCGPPAAPIVEASVVGVLKMLSTSARIVNAIAPPTAPGEFARSGCKPP
jgi:hypothetical protein